MHRHRRSNQINKQTNNKHTHTIIQYTHNTRVGKMKKDCISECGFCEPRPILHIPYALTHIYRSYTLQKLRRIVAMQNQRLTATIIVTIVIAIINIVAHHTQLFLIFPHLRRELVLILCNFVLQQLNLSPQLIFHGARSLRGGEGCVSNLHGSFMQNKVSDGEFECTSAHVYAYRCICLKKSSKQKIILYLIVIVLQPIIFLFPYESLSILRHSSRTQRYGSGPT